MLRVRHNGAFLEEEGAESQKPASTASTLEDFFLLMGGLVVDDSYLFTIWQYILYLQKKTTLKLSFAIPCGSLMLIRTSYHVRRGCIVLGERRIVFTKVVPSSVNVVSYSPRSYHPWCELLPGPRPHQLVFLKTLY